MTTAATAMPRKVRRARILTAAREQGEAWLRLSLTGMNRKDSARWRSARNMADLGELVVAWLNGEIAQTPGHCGPPCDETIPLIPALTAINRGGFVTDCSQLAESMDGRTWNTWVSGWADDVTLAKIREAAGKTPLIVGACRRESHECDRVPSVCSCAWKDLAGFWSGSCPAVGAAFRDLWYVHVEDPQDGRNDLLWPALAAALK